MRDYIIEAMKYWIVEFDFDGIRLDDSDITPYDFLVEIKQSLQVVKETLILISQAYDEYHHIEACNLTYDGNGAGDDGWNPYAERFYSDI